MKKALYRSPLGTMTILADDQSLYGLWFNDQKYFGGHYKLNEINNGITPQAHITMEWLDQYFSGLQPSYDKLNINPKVTPFQRRVYQVLEKMPYGETVTYQEISNAIQAGNELKKNLSRAVGNAVSHNQILLIIPCHRVIASNGQIGGYAGGVKRKQALLKLESTGRFQSVTNAPFDMKNHHL